MKSISNIRLKQIIVACLIILIASGYFSQKIQQANSVRRVSLLNAQNEHTTSTANQTYISQQLGGADQRLTPPDSLTQVYTAVIGEVRGAAPAHQVSLQSVSIAGRQLDQKGVPLAELAERVTIASQLKRIRVQVKGRYESLSQFEDYLDSVKSKQAVLHSLDINKGHL